MKSDKLTEEFFARHPLEVAEDLIGREVVQVIGRNRYSGTIIETAAYKGRSSRTGSGIAYPPGKLYIMFYRGGYFLNISTEAEDVDSCVQIRRLQIGEEELGPMQLTKRLRVDRSFDGKSLENDMLWVGHRKDVEFVSTKENAIASNCLGYYRAR